MVAEAIRVGSSMRTTELSRTTPRPTKQKNLAHTDDPDAYQRGTMMAEAIEVGSVLIIDDIMGHGSTVNEACRALRAAGFSTVMSLTLVKDVFGTRGYSFDVRYSNGGPADFASCRRLSRHRSRSEGVIDTCRRPTGSHRSSCYRHLRIASCIRFGDRESPPFWGTCNAVWVRRGLRKRARSRRRCTAKRTSCRWLDDRGAGRRVGQMEAAGRSPPAHQCATFRGRVEVRRRSGLDGLAGDGQKQLDHRAGSSVGRRSSSNHGRNMGGRSRVSQAGQAPACRRGFQHLAGGRREPRTHRSGGIPVSSFNELRQTLRVVKTTVPTFAAQQKRLI